MKNSNKNRIDKIKVVKSSFTSNNITLYAGINALSKFFNRKKITRQLGKLFPTTLYNSTKFATIQILMSIIMASLCGVNRISKISNFTQDPLIKLNLRLQKAINENAISKALKKLGQKGARTLQKYLIGYNSKVLNDSKLEHITMDADSTVSIVYGNQEGAAKGYNTEKKGANSYHALLLFVSELKLLYNTWFRTGSAHTANGIVELLKETYYSLPKSVKSVFFRADSGFFGGKLLDLLEFFGWDYLIKVKLKNLKQLLLKQTWTPVVGQKDVCICEFEYTTSSWEGKKRKLKAIRTIKEYAIREYFGKIERVPVYQYACYVSSYNNKNAAELHELYKPRSTSETWIEQVKSQLFAGKTTTDNFWANDILWQLNCFAYNLSVQIRNKHKEIRKQEHTTFREWFILVPARIVKSGNQVELKLYKDYYWKSKWAEFEEFINVA